ncbi:MAG: hypothetical protein NT120_04350 [Candidatus Aenigmarchaeota archaeon]|nr:hypothetical protein [Candidatus Aenigmarchaeota archaeon]
MFLDANEIRKIEGNVKAYLQDGILKKDPSAKDLVGIYMQNAERSFATASLLLDISDSSELKKANKMEPDFETYIWVLVASYYSMFYAANALLAKSGLRTSEKIAHKATSDALVVYFILNNKLAKSMYESYQESMSIAMDLTKQDMETFMKKAESLASALEDERRKRGKFQYNMKLEMKRSKAVTSLERAREFIKEIRTLVRK